MQIHRNDDGDSGRRRANPSPPVANRVHALGESHALRVDFEPVQLPWLAEEVDTLRRGIEHGLVRTRAFDGERAADAAEAELARREYQVRVLDLIRDQVPVRPPVAAACVASPWDDERSELVLELAGITAPIPVVGPARAMLVLLRGAVRNVTDALGESLRLSEHDVAERHVGTSATQWPESHRLTAAVASRFHDLAAAAQAFVENYVDAVRQQSYSFDPDHYPVDADELW